MGSSWRRTLGVLAVLIVLGATAYACREAMAVRLLARAANRTILRDTIAALPDGLHVGFCGTGSPFPSPTRSGPCTAIVASGRLFLVDAGRGTTDVVARMGFQAARLRGVFLTHFHSDHIDGLGQLGELHWLAGRSRAPLPVTGPRGVDRVVGGFNEAHAWNGTHRTAHHGAAHAPPAGFGLEAHAFAMGPGRSVTVFDQDGLRVTAFAVDHRPVEPAVGYRFDHAGRSVVVSGDTAPSANLVRVAHGADLLVHEAISPDLVGVLEDAAREAGRVPDFLFRDLRSFHTTPWDAADLASRAGVRMLALTHFIPPVPLGLLAGPFLRDAPRRFAGDLVLAQDGDLISLRAGSTTITRSNVLDRSARP